MMEVPAGVDESAKILVADDEESFLRSTSALLSDEGYNCELARNSDQAREALHGSVFDLLIADINMPGNRELEFLRDVSKAKETPVPVLVVTGYPSVTTAVESLRLEVVDYLIKPMDMMDFLSKVRSAITKGRAIRALRSAKEQVQSWVSNLQNLSKTLETTPSGSSSHAIELLISQTLCHIAQSAVDLCRLRSSGEDAVDFSLCSRLSCPRIRELEDAIRQSIDILNRTKTSFKSKELGALRRKLATILGPEPMTS
jgi:DNA-binding response OmpR family regulator